MAISTNQALPMLTNKVISVYRDTDEVKSFLRSFFPSQTTGTRYLSIEVERGTEKVAADVMRGADGNRNTMSRSTQKTFEPNYYREYFDISELDVYDRAVGSEVISESVFADLVNESARRVMRLQNKIDRAAELQCAQALQSGIVTSEAGVNIDFKRDNNSKVDLGASNYWNDSGVNPITSLSEGCEFLRTVGKARGGVFNLIMGSKAGKALINNPKIQALLDNRRMDLGSVREPQRDAIGSVYHGSISVDSWVVQLWTYPEYYTDDAGNQKPYIEDENAIMVPEAPQFEMGYAAVPQLIGDIPRLQEGRYLLQRFVDHKKSTDEFDLRSAFLAIPKAVDQIYTIQAVAS